MSVETLRRAAALMRERAEATAAPHHPYGDKHFPKVTGTERWMQECNGYLGGDMGVHCSSWHPDVAVAVADWLDTIVVGSVPGIFDYRPGSETMCALAVAHAYLADGKSDD